MLSLSAFSTVKITSSGTVTLQDQASINVNGDFLNYGNVDMANGSLVVFGEGNVNLFSHFNLDLLSLTVDKSSGTTTLYSYFIVHNNLILKNGIIDAYNARTNVLYQKKKKILSLSQKRTSPLKKLSDNLTVKRVRSADFLTLNSGTNIYRYNGSLNFSPLFNGDVNLFYYSAVNTGYEIPNDLSKLKKLNLNIQSGALNLTKDIKINELLKIENGSIETGSHTITMGEFAPIEGSPDDITGNIVGENLNFATSSYSNTTLGYQISDGNDLGNFYALLYKTPVQIGNHQSIKRMWKFYSENSPANRDFTFSWPSSADNHDTLPQLQVYNKIGSPNVWYSINQPTSVSSDPRQISISNPIAMNYFTVSDAIINTNTTSLDFGEVWVGNSSVKQFSLTNYQNESFSGTISFPSYISITQTSRDKSLIKINKNKEITRNEYSITLSANATINFNVTFSPTSAGNYEDNIDIQLSTNGNPAKRITFTGSAINPPDISVSPDSLETELAQNSTSTSSLSISNNGDDTLTYTASVQYTNRGSRSSTIDVYPANSNYSTGSCNASTKTENSLVKGHNDEDGWMKFDISSIPSDAVIDSVVFYGYVYDTNYPWWSVTPLEHDPVTTDANTLNADIVNEATSGYYLYRNEGSSYSTGWKQYTLGGNVVTDLTNAISQGWFAIGIATRDNSTSYYIDFHGWNETNKPYLKIFYHSNVMNWLTINNGSTYSNSLSSSATDNLTIGFDSSSLNDGTYHAKISISSNDPDESTVEIPVTLTVSTPNIAVSTTLLDYGTLEIGNTDTKSFTITNTGNGILTGQISTPTGYTVSEVTKNAFTNAKPTINIRNSLQFSISQGNTKTYNLVFEPSAEQSYNGNVVITNNSSSGTKYIEVRGTGVYVNISVEDTSYTKTLDINETTQDQMIISTTGQGTLTYTAKVVNPSRVRSSIDVHPLNSNKYTGSCNDSLITQNSLISAVGGNNSAGWMKFDVSAIPDDATIFNVELHAYVNNTHYPWWSVTPLSNDPQNTNADVLFNDITQEASNGYYLKSNESSSFGTGWKNYTLEGNIKNDLEASLTNDWFALGIASRDPNTNFFIDFDGWNETNPPYLSIEYAKSDEKWVLIDSVLTVQGTVTQANPDTLDLYFNSENLNYGDYTASISITSNDPNNSNVTIPITLHVIQNLQTPQNVSISATSSYITISWDDNGAPSYIVYASDTPNGTFTDVTNSGTFVTSRSRVSWRISATSQGIKKFYKIAASSQTTRFKISK